MLYIIVNPNAGTGRAALVWKKVQGILNCKKVEYRVFFTEYEGHATLLSKMISGEEAEDVCMAVLGGDGTINEAINGITDFKKVRFGVIPAGSGNDFAGGLGIRGTVEEIVSRMVKRMEEGQMAYWPMDLGKVDISGKQSRLFAISAGIGLDADVCRKVMRTKLKRMLNRIHLGNLIYLAVTVQTLFCMDTARVFVSLDGTKARKLEKVIFMAAMNFRAEGGGLPMAPKADPQDGKLSICAAYGIPKWKVFLLLPLLAAAKHENVKGFGVMDAKKSRICADMPMALHMDGEYCGNVRRAEFSCLPKLLRIMK